MKIVLHSGDISKSIKINKSVAIDTETMGLNPIRDRLCLIQLSTGNGICHLIKLEKNQKTKPTNLIKILKDKKILKIFHYARFDVGVLNYNYKINVNPVYCTKIASKLARTFTDKHGLKDLCKELLDIEISKTQQTSDWGKEKLSKSQLKYAANDVMYLHKIKKILDEMLLRENRIKLSQACFNFINKRTELDLLGWDQKDIFSH
tara:strand:+ start:968 stop:1582 length:615 start_codon:yes stop_codon:yes gene_type:complete